jgi:hypothetical protein
MSCCHETIYYAAAIRRVLTQTLLSPGPGWNFWSIVERALAALFWAHKLNYEKRKTCSLLSFEFVLLVICFTNSGPGRPGRTADDKSWLFIGFAKRRGEPG